MADPVADVRRWLQEAVVGLSLCPFAAPVVKAGQVRYATSDARTPEDAVAFALAEAAHLLSTPDHQVATTLVIFPHALSDFDTFLDVAATLEDLLVEAGAEGVLQVATFHPDYVFADADPFDLGNYTNRAPHPILHLLREDHITDAVAHHPNPDAIPARNVALLRDMGHAAVERLTRGHHPTDD